MYEKLLPVTSVKCSFCIQLTGIHFQLICTSHLLYFSTKGTVNSGTAIPHFWSILPRIRKLSEICSLYIICFGTHGGARGLNTEVQGRGFDYRSYHWKCSLTYPCSRIMAPGVGSASNNMCKAVPLHAWTGPEGSRKLRFPDFVTKAQDGGR